MLPFLASLFRALGCAFRTLVSLQLEILALRHQINVRAVGHSRRAFACAGRTGSSGPGLLRLWSGWHSALLIVKPETVIASHTLAAYSPCEY